MRDYQQFIDEKLHQLRLICLSQWDYLDYSDLRKWLDDNFANDIEGEYFATKILLHTIYYKKKDIEALLNYGLNEKIYGEQIKSELINSGNIFISNSEADGKLFRMKKSTFFMPLLDSNKPHESGNGIIGDLVHKLKISEQQVDFHWNVTEEKLKDFKTLIFVDDCIGSGGQLKKYWNSQPILRIRSICQEYSIQVYYLVVVGFKKNIDLLKDTEQLNGISIVVCDLLTEKHRIFSEENTVWDKSSGEREKAINYFERIRKQKGIGVLGYQKLDFAVILHDRLPNWSLPIFWKETPNWKILLRRKSS